MFAVPWGRRGCVGVGDKAMSLYDSGECGETTVRGLGSAPAALACPWGRLLLPLQAAVSLSTLGIAAGALEHLWTQTSLTPASDLPLDPSVTISSPKERNVAPALPSSS